VEFLGESFGPQTRSKTPKTRQLANQNFTWFGKWLKLRFLTKVIAQPPKGDPSPCQHKALPASREAQTLRLCVSTGCQARFASRACKSLVGARIRGGFGHVLDDPMGRRGFYPSGRATMPGVVK
jgi:hypothetical protein